MSFDYDGAVTADDAQEVLSKIVGLHERAVHAASRASTPARDALRVFAASLLKRSTASSPTSSSRIWPGSWTTSSASSRDRSSCGPRWWKSAIFRKAGRACQCVACRTANPDPQAPCTPHCRGHAAPLHANRTGRPLYESVPPHLYGGTERVVSYLTEELVSLGHEVTLFASGDAHTTARLIPACPVALWHDPTSARRSRTTFGWWRWCSRRVAVRL